MENIDEFVLEIDPARSDAIEEALAFYGDKLRLALPVIIRDEESEAFRKLIERFSSVWKWEAANVGGLNLLQSKAAGTAAIRTAGVPPAKNEISADWPLYTLNTQAAL